MMKKYKAFKHIFSYCTYMIFVLMHMDNSSTAKIEQGIVLITSPNLLLVIIIKQTNMGNYDDNDTIHSANPYPSIC